MLEEFCEEQHKNALAAMFNSEDFVVKLGKMSLVQRNRAFDILTRISQKCGAGDIIGDRAAGIVAQNGHLRRDQLSAAQAADLKRTIDACSGNLSQQDLKTNAQACVVLQQQLPSKGLEQIVEPSNEELVEESIPIKKSELNFFLYAAITNTEAFKALHSAPQVDRCFYEGRELEFQGHKFSSWALVLVLAFRNTELLKVLLHKQNFVFSRRDFHSFVAVCLGSHKVYQHLLRNFLTAYPTIAIFQQLEQDVQKDLVVQLLEKVAQKDMGSVVTNIFCKKPFLSQTIVLILEKRDLPGSAEIAKAGLMALTEEDIVFMARDPLSSAPLLTAVQKGFKSNTSALD